MLEEGQSEGKIEEGERGKEGKLDVEDEIKGRERAPR